jgi:hypothetical protein
MFARRLWRVYGFRKRRMPAIPAAPAERQAAVLAAVTPPRARTGMGAAARQASAKSDRPTPGRAGASVRSFSKTGP